jgi:ELWxxDGT repeat protein
MPTTRAVFEGFGLGLWVTDGTSAGTDELTVAGANAKGLFSALPGANPHFTVLGGKALFVGLDAKSQFGLWVTDGASAGTSELKVGVGGVDPDLTVFGKEALFFDSSGVVTASG